MSLLEFLQAKGISLPHPSSSYTTLEVGGKRENGIICHQNVDFCVPTYRTAYKEVFGCVISSFVNTALLVLSVFRQELP